MVRVALALANMASDKVDDHVARLLRKDDVGKVASKAKLAVAMEHEQALQTGFDIAMTLGGLSTNCSSPCAKCLSGLACCSQLRRSRAESDEARP